MDSQIVIGVIAIAVAVVGIIIDYRKKSADTSKMDSSQSAINSSGIVQQSASQIKIDKQIIIHNADKIFGVINKPKKIQDIKPQLTELHQPLKKKIPKISQETLKKIYSTFPLKTIEYDNRYMFFKTIDEFEKSSKFISVNGKSFMDGSKTQAIENAYKNLYETPNGQFILISKQAWKDMGYDFPQIIF